MSHFQRRFGELNDFGTGQLLRMLTGLSRFKKQYSTVLRGTSKTAWTYLSGSAFLCLAAIVWIVGMESIEWNAILGTYAEFAASYTSRSELSTVQGASIRQMFLSRDNQLLQIIRSRGLWQLRDSLTGNLINSAALTSEWLSCLDSAGHRSSWVGISQKNELHLVYDDKLIWMGRLAEQENNELLVTCSMSRENQLVSVTSGSNKLWILKISDHVPSTLGILEFNEPLRFAKFSPTGSHLLLVAGSSKVAVWNTSTMLEEVTLEEPLSGAEYGCWSDDGSRIAIFGSSYGVSVCEAATGQRLRRLKDGPVLVFSSALSADGRKIAIGDEEVLEIWDVDSGLEEAVLFGHEAVIRAIQFDSSGHTVYSGDMRGQVCRWSLANGSCDWVAE